MANRLNRTVLFIGVLAVMALTAAIFTVLPAWVKAATSYVSYQTTSSATTTAGVAFLSPGIATSTYQIDNGIVGGSLTKVQTMGEVDAATVLVEYVASSTSAILNVQPQISNNGIDWYNVGSQAVANANGQTAVASSTYQYTPLASATTTITINLTPVAALHERLVFFVTGANASIYAEVGLKRNPSTP